MKKPNKLINMTALIALIKQGRISRINTEALQEIEKQTEEKIKQIIENLSQNIKIKGRKTLLKEDIIKIFEKNQEYPEI